MIQAPDNLQSYNRYSYVMNNPLIYSDPTGYWGWGWNPFKHFVAYSRAHAVPTPQNVYRVVRANPAQAQLDHYNMTHPWAYQGGQAVATYYGGAAGAAFWSGYYTYQSTGSINAANRAAVVSFAITSATSYFSSVVGGYFPMDGTVGNFVGNVAGNVAIGCAASEAGGGNCRQGALSSGFSAAAGSVGAFDNLPAQMIIGGTASVLGGGKFANGAITAAFSYLATASSDDLELDANFNNEAGAFSTDTPPGLEALRAANPELAQRENQIWENSQPVGFWDSLFGNSKEQALIVYQNRSDGSLIYDLRYKASSSNYKVSLKGLSAPRGYDIVLIEHTHPFTFSLGLCAFKCIARGPSPADWNAAKAHPNAYNVIQAQPPANLPREFEYYGLRTH